MKHQFELLALIMTATKTTTISTATTKTTTITTTKTTTITTKITIKPSQMEVAPLHRTFVISHKRRLFKNTKGI